MSASKWDVCSERLVPDVKMWDAESSINDKPYERGGEEQRESTTIPSSKYIGHVPNAALDVDFACLQDRLSLCY